MAIRDTLLANLAVALNGTSVSVSSELPFTAAGLALYEKNMKKLYLDVDQNQTTELLPTLTNDDVWQQEVTVNGYLTVDAKNQPSDIQTIVGTVFNSRLSVANCYLRECRVATEFVEDRNTYIFEFRFLTI